MGPQDPNGSSTTNKPYTVARFQNITPQKNIFSTNKRVHAGGMHIEVKQYQFLPENVLKGNPTSMALSTIHPTVLYVYMPTLELFAGHYYSL